MSRFDEAMKEAMRRRAPPAGFAERVLAKAAEQETRPSGWRMFLDMFRAPKLRWAGVVAAVVLVIAGAQLYTERRERIRGEQARDQVLLALEITAKQIHSTRQKVLRITAMENEK